MAYSTEAVKRARDRLAQAKADRETENLLHLQEAYGKLPRLREIDRQLRQTMAAAAQAVFMQGEGAKNAMERAKEQNLSLNSTKISGACGRLMCCLRYENDVYEEELKKTPPVDSVVKTANGIGFVTETNPLAGTIKVKLKDKPDNAPELYKREDVTLISRPSKSNDDKD